MGFEASRSEDVPVLFPTHSAVTPDGATNALGESGRRERQHGDPVGTSYNPDPA